MIEEVGVKFKGKFSPREREELSIKFASTTTQLVNVLKFQFFGRLALSALI